MMQKGDANGDASVDEEIGEMETMRFDFVQEYEEYDAQIPDIVRDVVAAVAEDRREQRKKKRSAPDLDQILQTMIVENNR
jgi:hypothetical protein